MAFFSPSFLAQPPVRVMLFTAPAFFAITKQRLATAIWMPAAISSGALPSPTSAITSDSANTVHWAVMGTAFFAFSEREENSSRLISNERAMAS